MTASPRRWDDVVNYGIGDYAGVGAAAAAARSPGSPADSTDVVLAQVRRAALTARAAAADSPSAAQKVLLFCVCFPLVAGGCSHPRCVLQVPLVIGAVCRRRAPFGAR